jgi:ABC-type Fe3+/spermidine/putrescine transport system ATPase subunit
LCPSAPGVTPSGNGRPRPVVNEDNSGIAARLWTAELSLGYGYDSHGARQLDSKRKVTVCELRGDAYDPHTMHGVRLQDVSFGYGLSHVVDRVSLEVDPGQLIALVGPSGCGKTTLLKLIGGYFAHLAPSTGRIHLRGRDVTSLPPEARNVGMVFQNYALFPHLSARDNVAFGLVARRIPRPECHRRVESMLDRVGLGAEERSRTPAELSGGQQQRVALARALVIEPDVLLLDEPLANLDRNVRESLRVELRVIQRDTGVTTILVTHDQEEALAISERVGVMAAGRILQIGQPADVYAHPRTPFVARFLGAANLLDGKVVGCDAGEVVMVRPEACIVNQEPGADSITWPGRVAEVAFLGADRIAEIACENGVALRIRTRAVIAVGERLTVSIPQTALWRVPDADDVDPGAKPGSRISGNNSTQTDRH